MPADASDSVFFVAGGTVPPGSPSYIARAADHELYDALKSGQYCYVLNSRQMGKSSLAVRTITRLAEDGIHCAFVDLTRLGGATVTVEQWYAGLLVETGRTFGLRSEAASYLKDHRDIGPVQRYLNFLQESALPGMSGPVVLMIDEIDAVRSLSFPSDELFAGIRQLHNGRATNPALSRLTICLLGAALPSDLISDPRTTPFNIGKRVGLRDFSPEEAKPLANGFGPRGNEILGRVMYWTGGHPFLTQVLCSALVEKGNPTVSDVDLLVQERYLDARARESDTNLADVANRLLGRGDPNVTDALRADTLSLYAKLAKGGVPDDESDPCAARIKMSGVARLEGSRLVPRNKIYASVFDRTWIKNNMPGEELRRQQRAYLRGVVRTSIVSGCILVIVASMAAIALRSARIARAEQRKAQIADDRSEKLAMAEGIAKKDALAAVEEAKISLKRARNAEAKSKESAAQEHTAKLAAQKAEAAAEQSEKRAKELLYTSDMALTAQMLDHGSGVQMAEYLGLNGKSAQEIKNAGWEQRHFYAVLHEATELRKKGDRVDKVAFTPSGRLIARDLKMRISVWNPDSGKLLHQFQPTDRPNGIAADISRSGRQACLTLANGNIDVLSSETLQTTKTIIGIGTPIEFVELPDVPDTMQGWFGLENRLVNLNTGTISRALGFANHGDYSRANVPAVLPKNRFLKIEGDFKDQLSLFDFDQAGRIRILWKNTGRNNTLSSKCASQSGSLIAYGDSFGYVQILDGDLGKSIGLPLTNSSPVQALAFSEKEDQLATAGLDGVITIWQVSDGAQLRRYRGAYGNISCLSFSQKGDRLAFGTEDGRIGYYDLNSFSNALDAVGVASDIAIFSVSQDGNVIAVPNPSQSRVDLIDAHKGVLLTSAKCGPASHAPAFSPDGHWLASAGQGDLVWLWDTRTRRARRFYLRLRMPYAAIAFSSDSRRLAVFGRDITNTTNEPQKLALFDVQSGKRIGPVVESSGYERATFSPDGHFLAACWQGGRISIFNSNDLGIWKDVFRNSDSGKSQNLAGSYPTSIAFTPDSRQFLVGWSSGQIEVFDSQTAKSIHIWSAHTGEVTGLAFTDGSRTLISTSDDHRVRMWTFGNWRNVADMELPVGLSSLAFNERDSAAYVGDRTGLIHALRTHYPLPPRSIDSQPPTDESWDSAIRESKKTGKPIFFPVFHSFNAYDRALRSFLKSTEMRSIIERHFVLFAPWQGSKVLFKGRRTDLEQVYSRLFGTGVPDPSIEIVSSKGAVLFDGMRLVSGRRIPMRIPQDPVTIDKFLAALDLITKGLSNVEKSKLRAFLLASGRPYKDSQSTIDRFNSAKASYLRARDKLSPLAGLAAVGKLQELDPTDSEFLADQANYLARLDRWEEAAAAYANARGVKSQNLADREVCQQSAAFSLAGDLENLKSLVDRLDPPNDIGRAMIWCVCSGMLTNLTPRQQGVAKLVDEHFSEAIKTRNNRGLGLAYSLILFRTGNLAGAESLARQALNNQVALDSDSDTLKVRRVILALILAKKGDLTGAGQELKAAEAAFRDSPPDGDLVAGNIKVDHGRISLYWTPLYAVLRREVGAVLAKGNR